MKLINWFDSLLPAFFDKIRCPLLDKTMVFFTKMGDMGLVWIFISVGFIYAYKYSKYSSKNNVYTREGYFRVGASGFCSFLACFYFGNRVLKPFFSRIRPCNLYPEIELLIKRPEDFSFPSMHAATAFSVAVVLYRYDKRFGVPAIILAMLISLSRVYLNVHYTTDIIAGAVLGTVFALAFYWFFKFFTIRKNT